MVVGRLADLSEWQDAWRELYGKDITSDEYPPAGALSTCDLTRVHHQAADVARV